MKKLLRLAFCFISLVAIFCNSGCRTISELIISKKINDSMSTLLEKPVSMVVAQYGLPTFRYPDGIGGELLVYESDVNIVGNNAYISSSRTYKAIRTFFVTKEGIVYNYSWKGL